MVLAESQDPATTTKFEHIMKIAKLAIIAAAASLLAASCCPNAAPAPAPAPATSSK